MEITLIRNFLFRKTDKTAKVGTLFEAPKIVQHFVVEKVVAIIVFKGILSILLLEGIFEGQGIEEARIVIIRNVIGILLVVSSIVRGIEVVNL